MNKRQFKEWATSLTALGFLIIAISGIMLYFHILSSNVKLLHELLGLAFATIVIGHVFANWNAMKSYFSKKVFMVSTLIVVAISSAFVINSLNQPSSPKGFIINSLLTTNIDNALKVLNIEYTQASALLKQHNIELTHNTTIQTLAQQHKMNPFNVITLLNQAD